MFYYELLIGPQPTFSECIVISSNLICQLCLSGPGYTSSTVQSKIQKCNLDLTKEIRSFANFWMYSLKTTTSYQFRWGCPNNGGPPGLAGRAVLPRPKASMKSGL